jgi:hypothetical protein
MDLLGVHLAERAAEHGEVLGEHEHLAAVDHAPAGDDAIGEGPRVLDAEAVGAVTGEHVELHEGAFVEEDVDPLASGELAAVVLPLDRRVGSRVPRLLLQLGQLLEALLERHRRRRGRARFG